MTSFWLGVLSAVGLAAAIYGLVRREWEIAVAGVILLALYLAIWMRRRQNRS